MHQQLNTALDTLEEAVDSYARTCQTVYSRYVAEQPINTIPHHLASGLPYQLSRIESLREKLKRTETFLYRSMNASSSLVPIHAFPSEILTRIFELAQGDDCIARCPGRSQVSAVLLLMDTCSHWRQVAVNSPTLWTHIDLRIRDSDAGRMTLQTNHVKLYAERAGQMPLHVHIIHRTTGRSGDSTFFASLSSLIGLIAPRIRSFICQTRNVYPPTYGPVFSELFRSCTPGVLKVLDTDIGVGETLFYLDADPTAQSNSSVLLVEAPKERLEDIYIGINTLRLCHVLPRWTSSAYRGLVELRLSGDAFPPFTESQLVGALRHSPGLRVFECETTPASPLELDELVDPIPLVDLEVVNLGRIASPGIEAIVRWLVPGSKPLQFLVTVPGGSLGHDLVAFLARSKITHAYILANHPGNVLCLANHLPHMQYLAIADRRMDLSWDDWGDEELTAEHDGSGAVLGVLKTIYVLGYYLTGLHIFDEWPAWRLLRRIVFHRCTLGSDIISEVSKSNPKASVETIPDMDQSPVADWEVFTPYGVTRE